jgi:hypothetical protein
MNIVEKSFNQLDVSFVVRRLYRPAH